MNILFWNTNRKNPENVTACLCELLSENAIDLLILAEYPNETKALCKTINKKSNIEYNSITSVLPPKNLRAIINPKYSAKNLQAEARYQILHISNQQNGIIVAAIHGYDIRNHPKIKDRETLIRQFKTDIIEHEQKQKCPHTVAIGDFNVSPYEEPAFTTDGMHALPFSDSFEKPTKVKGTNTKHKKFYNPTWRFFANVKPPFTTYRYEKDSGTSAFYWYALDQVMISPSLIPFWDENSPKIITKTANHNLIKKTGQPNTDIYSDHLPLFCQLKEDFI